MHKQPEGEGTQTVLGVLQLNGVVGLQGAHQSGPDRKCQHLTLNLPLSEGSGVVGLLLHPGGAEEQGEGGERLLKSPPQAAGVPA